MNRFLSLYFIANTKEMFSILKKLSSDLYANFQVDFKQFYYIKTKQKQSYFCRSFRLILDITINFQKIIFIYKKDIKKPQKCHKVRHY